MRFAIFILLFSIVAMSVEGDEVDSIIGLRQMRSVGFGEFLSATSCPNSSSDLCMMAHSKKSATWKIQKHGKKVSVMSVYEGKYRYYPDNVYVRLSNWDNESNWRVLWTPIKNENGSWSFESQDGRFLYGSRDGFVFTFSKIGSNCKFWIRETDD